MAQYQGRSGDGAAQPNGVTVNTPDLNVDTNVIAAAFPCPEEVETPLAASPSEFDKYLLEDTENWCVVKHEVGLEEQTASLTIQEHHQQEIHQAGPSTSANTYTSSLYMTMEGEVTTYTDMTSTMRVTREATDALYSEHHLPYHAHNPSDLTQYLSRTAVNTSEAQDTSPTALVPFMNTPSPSSSNSDGSHCVYTSPHYSPQNHPTQGFYGTYTQAHNPPQKQVATSPTYSCAPEPSPPTYNHLLPSQATPTYNLAPAQGPSTYSHIFCQTTPTYSYQQDLVTPTCSQPPENAPSAPRPRTAHISPGTTPLPAHIHAHTSPYPEDSKVRNGKMYTTYLNNHGMVVPKFERPARHPSGPTPSPAGQGRPLPALQYPEHKMYPLPSDMSFSPFFPGFDGSFNPYQLPTGHPATQNGYGLCSFAYPNNFGGLPNMSSQVTTQLPASYPTAGTAPHSSKGGARRKTYSNNNNSKREPNRESPKRFPVGPHIKVKERNARRIARKLSLGVIKAKRGCTCYTCQIVFASSGHLKRHMEAHGSNRRFKCPHPYCDVAYSRQDNLKTHVAKAIHRREGDPYAIPVSDSEDSDEEADFGGDNNIIGMANFGDYEPEDGETT